MTRCHSTINLRVRTGPCRGVSVVVPKDLADDFFESRDSIMVAGWSKHVIYCDDFGVLYLQPVSGIGSSVNGNKKILPSEARSAAIKHGGIRRSRLTGKLYLAPIHALEQEAV